MERTNPFRLNSQNYRLLECLYNAPTTNRKMVREMGIFNYTGRISEMRRHGFDILCTPVPDRPGLTVYQLIK